MIFEDDLLSFDFDSCFDNYLVFFMLVFWIGSETQNAYKSDDTATNSYI
jgi:hypothetical protein